MAKGTGKKMSGGGKIPGKGSANGGQKPLGKGGGNRAIGGVSSSTAGKKW